MICYHEIIHYRIVVGFFKSLHVVSIDDVAEVPRGAPVMLRAHGSPPPVIDAVCPLVAKAHHELKVRSPPVGLDL
jgi:4-hydroxy-3-methylbut-2-enyl diphosphate reductase